MDRLNTCKVTGCREPVRDRAGRYAGLCEGHKAARQEQRIVQLPPPSRESSATVARARALLKAARQLDRALARLRAVPTQAAERKAFIEASRRAQQDPTEANLSALTDATRQLRKGLPLRSTRQAEFERALKAVADGARGLLEATDAMLAEPEAQAA